MEQTKRWKLDVFGRLYIITAQLIIIFSSSGGKEVRGLHNTQVVILNTPKIPTYTTWQTLAKFTV